MMGDTTDHAAERAAYTEGKGAGSNAAEWVELDSPDGARRILQGFTDGDPEIMDIQPYPLSGEWAGESIPELSDLYGLDLSDETIAHAFERGFDVGYWDRLTERCRYQLDTEEDQ
jgi:hypothetical protein